VMLAASRRKGDYAPGLSFGFLGNPLVLTIVYLIYLGGVFAYGVFVWEDPFRRLLAVGVGIMILIVTYFEIRQGAFAPRVVVELKVEVSDADERATLAIVDAGQPLKGTFRFVYANEERSAEGSEVEIPSFALLKSISVELEAPSSKEMKVWVHRVTPEGISDAIPAALRIRNGDTDRSIQLDSRSSHLIMPLTSRASKLEIAL